MLHPLLILATLVLQDPNRIAGASNVRLRTAPADTAAVAATVALGTPLVELESGGESAAWVRVRLADGRDGWMPAQLTRRFTSETRWSTTEALIKERLARQGDSFAARVELLNFVEQSTSTVTDPEASGRQALYWLQAITRVVDRIPPSLVRAEPYASWLATRKEVLVFNTPARRWLVRQETMRALHRREQDTSAADEIAFFAANHGMPGECEGFVPCHARRSDALEGEYLRRHPAGRHAAEAVATVASRAAEWTRKPSAGFFFDPARDCGELAASIEPLRAAVAATRVEAREGALKSLEVLRLACTATGRD